MSLCMRQLAGPGASVAGHQLLALLSAPHAGLNSGWRAQQHNSSTSLITPTDPVASSGASPRGAAVALWQGQWLSPALCHALQSASASSHNWGTSSGELLAGSTHTSDHCSSTLQTKAPHIAELPGIMWPTMSEEPSSQQQAPSREGEQPPPAPLQCSRGAYYQPSSRKRLNKHGLEKR